MFTIATFLIMSTSSKMADRSSSVMESAVSQVLKKIEIFVEGFLSSPYRDSY
jgi:hypothetical protein